MIARDPFLANRHECHESSRQPQDNLSIIQSVPAKWLPVEDAVLAGVMLAAVDGRRVDRHDGDEEEGERRPHPVHVVSLQGDESVFKPLTRWSN